MNQTNDVSKRKERNKMYYYKNEEEEEIELNTTHEHMYICKHT